MPNTGPVNSAPLGGTPTQQKNPPSPASPLPQYADLPRGASHAPSPQRMEYLDGHEEVKSRRTSKAVVGELRPVTIKHPIFSNAVLQAVGRGTRQSSSEPSGTVSSAPDDLPASGAGADDTGRHWAEAFEQGPTQVEQIAARDALARTAITDALASLLRDRSTTSPLSVGLFGEWGSGKSSQINFLKNELAPRISEKPEIRIVEFNAWEHEKCDNLSAALAQTVVDHLTSGTSLWEQWQLARQLAARKRQHITEAAQQDRDRFLAWFYRWVVPFISFEMAAAFVIVLLIFQIDVAAWAKAIVSLGVFGLSGWKSVNKYVTDNLTNWFKRIAGGAGGGPFGLPDFAAKLGSFHDIRETLQHLIALRVKGGEAANAGQYLLIVVDDLDRCSVGTIKLVLDAVRMVTSMPRVVTMVAVDDRIAFPAVESFFEQFKGSGRDASVVARDYLAKVFNVSISLPPVSAALAARFIAERLFAEGDDRPTLTKTADQPVDGLDAAAGPRSPSSLGRTTGATLDEVKEFTRLAYTIGMTNPRALWRMKQAWYLLRSMVVAFGDVESTFEPWMQSLFVREAVLTLPSATRNEIEAWARDVKSNGRHAEFPEGLPPRFADLLRKDIGGIQERWPYANIVLLPAAASIAPEPKPKGAAT